MNFVTRYEAGDHHAVWRELIAAGDAVRGELRSEAVEVVRLTMVRVRRNVEMLVAELARRGFRFGLYPDGEPVPGYGGPLVPPQPEEEQNLRELERVLGGVIPLAIHGFWRYVGSVCLVGYGEGWPDYSDPLWIEGPTSSLDELSDWKLRCEEGDEDEPFGLIIAPDLYHKDNVSGGAPYEIAVPNAAIDGLLRNSPREEYFIDHIRTALAWGGFPGAERAGTPLPEWLTLFAKQLEPF